MSQWRVDFVSGSFVDWFEFEAKDMLDAIDKASSALTEEQDPLWPWQANEAVISVRRIRKDNIPRFVLDPNAPFGVSLKDD